jgi:hypothetical protein
MSMVTSAASPSAPSAAAEKLVAMLKKITVPPSAVARIAPCSQPGTSTQTTVTSAGPPRRRSTARRAPPDRGRRRGPRRPGCLPGELDLLVHGRHHAEGSGGAGTLCGRQGQRAGLARATDDHDGRRDPRAV